MSVPTMELRHLRYFVAVAEELNYRKAAERLHLTQPSLSIQIKDLEYELGVRLLERDTTGVRLTDAGSVYLNEAQDILAQVQRAATLAHEAAEGLRGRLTIGNVGPLSSSFMPSSLAAFRRKFPAVDVVLLEMRASEQFAGLDSGTIQVGFTAAGKSELPDDLSHFSVLRTQLCVAVGRSHRLARSALVSLSSLTNEKLLCFSDQKQASGHAERVRGIFTAHKLKPGPINLIEGYESLHALIAGGQGVSIIPPVSSAIRAEGIVLKPFKETDAALAFEVHAVWRARETSQLALNFIEVLRKLKQQEGTSLPAPKAKRRATDKGATRGSG